MLLVVALVVLAVLGVSIFVNVQVMRAINDIEVPQPQGQTVVYSQDGQGSRGVPLYDVPTEPNGQLLPNFTAVQMICWEDAGGLRWFRVRAEPGSAIEVSQTVIVQADHVHHQTRVDHC
jgi:hypothetical protein